MCYPETVKQPRGHTTIPSLVDCYLKVKNQFGEDVEKLKTNAMPRRKQNGVAAIENGLDVIEELNMAFS